MNCCVCHEEATQVSRLPTYSSRLEYGHIYRLYCPLCVRAIGSLVNGVTVTPVDSKLGQAWIAKMMVRRFLV